MSINYAQLRRSGRRQSVNTDFRQYHKLSQDKTFTESFPVSIQKNKPNFKNQLSQLEFDDHQIDFKNHPFTFQDKTEVTKKKFVFDENHSTKQGEFKTFINAMDDYIDLLNESSECFTITSEKQSQLENVLFNKFNLIQQKHEELINKYKSLQQNYKAQKYQNQVLKQQLIGLHQQFENEQQKNQLITDHHSRLKQKYKDLQLRNHYLQNSLLKEKLKQDKKLINLQQSYDESDNNTYQQTHETNETNEDQQNVTKFLKSQMRKLKYNNQQIDDYSRLYKKYSEHNNDDF